MMNLRNLILFRRLTTSSLLRRPQLSDNYKSSQLWNERFSCKLISDESLIRSVNNKIIIGSELNNLEVDIFVHIASPSTKEIAQLRESTRLLKIFRKSLYAHTLLPSTPHALCRLFLSSARVASLASILERRIEYGVFPDLFSMNLLLDDAIERKNYALASRLAAIVMLQEEFGLNRITDALSLYALASYIESKTDFTDWIAVKPESDPILIEKQNDDNSTSSEKKEEGEEKEEKKVEEEEEEEEEAEYVRIPFLRNPYNDNHFDIKSPRLICGKILGMLSKTLPTDSDVFFKAAILSDVLQGNWDIVEDRLKKGAKHLGKVAEVCQHYMDNLHEVNGPSEEQKKALQQSLKRSSSGEESLTLSVDSYYTNLNETESIDIEQLGRDMVSWSESRLEAKQLHDNLIERHKLIAEIKAKKEAIRLREQYLYFYDNLRKSRVTRIEYE